MALNYTMQGDYLIPNIFLPKQETNFGKYGIMRRTYLMNEKTGEYTTMMLKGTLNQHLTEIDSKAMALENKLIREMAIREGVTEEMKAADQMKWVGLMNNFRMAAEEIVRTEMIYI